jgi:hypothetical protein
MCARFEGTMSLSSPTKALPVALMRFSPLDVSGRSVVPVCLSEISWSLEKYLSRLSFHSETIQSLRDEQ